MGLAASCWNRLRNARRPAFRRSYANTLHLPDTTSPFLHTHLFPDPARAGRHKSVPGGRSGGAPHWHALNAVDLGEAHAGARLERAHVLRAAGERRLERFSEVHAEALENGSTLSISIWRLPASVEMRANGKLADALKWGMWGARLAICTSLRRSYQVADPRCAQQTGCTSTRRATRD